ncbi:TIGR04452 family lipoprotein [Leptospira andrefontaineae]|uniref:TIGR04452 family lipoprotein n=1 Tax=Leptospira andrefontaineae TaxID=2484976 RepID=A0A4R9GXV9_9LEPT|nr:TIGR04452 family lipoprotein [Leptospira andrefontaineae]TGK35631.1 TIGR04452 family lipoprotein [Leptospira andrefontaineae]
MRKILFVGMISLLTFANCVAVDSLGLSDAVKGSEARSQIKAAALTSDILFYGSADPANAAMITALDLFLTDIYLKIDDSKYYKKSDVDKCVKDVQTIGLLVMDPSQTVLTSKNCSDLQANGPII